MTFKHRLLFILAIVLVAGCQNEAPKMEAQPPRPVRTLIVAAGGSEQKATFNGAAVAGKESSLSFKVSGTMESMPISVGDKVKKG